MNPEGLSRQLREGAGRFLARRREVVGTSLVSIGSMALISLYQTGIKYTGWTPQRRFTSMLSMPDGPKGLGSYAATLALAAMGGEDRAREKPWIPLALAAKAALRPAGRQAHHGSVDAAQGVLLLVPPRLRGYLRDRAARDPGGPRRPPPPLPGSS